MKKNVKNLLIISIFSGLGAVGMGYLLIFFLNMEITDVGEFFNGLMAMVILCIALAGLALYSFFELIGLMITHPKQSTTISVH